MFTNLILHRSAAPGEMIGASRGPCRVCGEVQQPQRSASGAQLRSAWRLIGQQMMKRPILWFSEHMGGWVRSRFRGPGKDPEAAPRAHGAPHRATQLDVQRPRIKRINTQPTISTVAVMTKIRVSATQ